MRYPERAWLALRALATAFAVAWLGLEATPWACVVAAKPASRPRAVEIRFSPTNMGLSFSRQYPTRLLTNGARDTSFGSGMGPTRLVLEHNRGTATVPHRSMGPGSISRWVRGGSKGGWEAKSGGSLSESIRLPNRRRNYGARFRRVKSPGKKKAGPSGPVAGT